MEWSLWLPLILIFASALLAALIKRYTKDICLKIFDRSFVYVRLKTGAWVWGYLQVYSNCLELEYAQPHPFGQQHHKLSYVLYEHHLQQIDRLFRPSPRPGSPAYREWLREIQRLQHPSPLRRARRKLRILFNMLRDAFSQSIGFVLGAAKQRTRLGKIPLAEERVGEMGRTLFNVVPNAYEPILEKYLGRDVVVESAVADRIFEHTGTLQEYSSQYLLIRNVRVVEQMPAECPGGLAATDQYDIAFPRPAHWVRHLAEQGQPLVPVARPANREPEKISADATAERSR